jgi:hypothetical protein
MLLAHSAYYSILKMEAIHSSEVSVNSRQTTRYHIPKDSNLHVHHHKNFKSHKIITVRKSSMHGIPDDGNRKGL